MKQIKFVTNRYIIFFLILVLLCVLEKRACMEAMGMKSMKFSVWQLPQQLLKKPEKGNIYYITRYTYFPS